MSNQEIKSTVLLSPPMGNTRLTFDTSRQGGVRMFNKHAQAGRGRRSFLLWTLLLSIPVLYLCQQLLKRLEAINGTEQTHLRPKQILDMLAGMPSAATHSLAIGIAVFLLVLFSTSKTLTSKGSRGLSHRRTAALASGMISLFIIPPVIILFAGSSSETMGDLLIGGSVIGMMIAIAINVLHARQEMDQGNAHPRKTKPQPQRPPHH